VTQTSDVTLTITGDADVFFGNASHGKTGTVNIGGVNYTGLTQDDTIFLGNGDDPKNESYLVKEGAGLVQFVGENFVAGTVTVKAARSAFSMPTVT